METITLFISAIRALPECQMRHDIDKRVVSEFKDAMLAGDVFPPVEVVFDLESGDYILVDGFTRLEATKAAEFTRIDATVVAEGNGQLAQKLALKANAKNSQRRTHMDRERAIAACINHPDFKNAKEEEIAEATATSRREVFRVRDKMGLRKNPDRRRDSELEGALKIIKEDSPTLADNISVGIIDMPRGEILRLAAMDDEERKTHIPLMQERRLTLKQSEQLNKYVPQSEDLSLKIYLDFNERHPDHTEFYFRGHTKLVTITSLP